MPLDRWQPRRNGDDDRPATSDSRSSALDSDKQGESSKASQRSRYSPGADRGDDGSSFPNKARRIYYRLESRIDDRLESRFDRDARERHQHTDRNRDSRDNIASTSSSSRRTEGTRDAVPPALTIRGVAASQRPTSPSRQPVKENEDRPPRARSPDLFDRLNRRRDDANGSARSRPETSLRSRLEDETSRESSDPPRRTAPKLAPRGQYDEDGRRIDAVPDRTDSRDRRRGLSSRDDPPTSPRRRELESRRIRDRSGSPVSVDRSGYRAADSRDDRSTRPECTRTWQRSPSTSSTTATRSQWDRSSNKYDRYERRRSPPPRSTTRYDRAEQDTSATSTLRLARWGSRAHLDDDNTDARSRGRDDPATPTRQRRWPSPTRSDTSNRSRRRDGDQETVQRSTRDRDIERGVERSRPEDRPARWRINNNNDGDLDKDSTRARGDLGRDGDEDKAIEDSRPRRDGNPTGPTRYRRRSPDSHRPRTPPLQSCADDGADRGHVLLRKSAISTTLDGKQPPTGPRGQTDAANQRSIRGGGWQTVRPGSRPDRNASASNNNNNNNNDNNNNNNNNNDNNNNNSNAYATGKGREGKKHSEADTRRVKRPLAEPGIPAEARRAEAGEAYESIHQVGEGTYGQVFKARSERTGALVALKKIRMDSEKDGFPVTVMREIKLLQALRHENVVRLHEMMVTRGSIYMVFEYMEHDLNGILAHPQVEFSDAHLKSLAQQLFSGLDYLHRKAVLHRDLKGSNLLLNNQGRLKLADFGLARFYAKRREGDYTNRVVTLWYRPPELLFGETKYGSEVDMWGAGCILLELFVKKPVFQSETELGQVTAITDILGPVTKENWPEVDKLAWYEMVKPVALAAVAEDEEEAKRKDYVGSNFGKHMPEAALQVARGLLRYDPKKRWTAKEALASDYFSQEPKAELPAGLLSALEGEWHEYESRRAKKKATGHRVSDKVGTDNATGQTASSTNATVVRDPAAS